jgi:hypothetical protein
MAKVLKVVALGALFVGATIVSGGLAAAAAAGVALSAGAVAVSIGATLAASVAVSGIFKTIKGSGSNGGGLSDLTRLNLTDVASAPRKMVLGTTAFAVDLRYDEPSGTDQRFVDIIVHLASHKSTSVDELRLGDKVAWTAGGGVTTEFAGFMTVEFILEAGAAAYHTVNAGTKWNSTTRLTGCTTAKLRFDRQGTKKANSPFSGGIPNQMVIIGRGMPVYDPRRDSTVPGGSGAHRVNNQATWQFVDGSTDLGNNPALQALAYLLGWRVNGVVSCGLGLPVDRLDLAAFAASANACDEAITLAAGGTQRRYESAGLIADNRPPADVMRDFADATGGWWDDSTGKMGLFVAVNDFSGALVTFGDDDILSGVSWVPFPDITEQYNVVRGLNPEPTLPANFQPTDYPEVSITSSDGIDRVLSLNLALVQDKARAQRIAKQALQRQQYRGVFSATFGIRAWQVDRGQPVALNFGALGWTLKKFRVEEMTINADGTVNLTLREENAAIYAWAAEETAPVVPASPITYDPLNSPWLIQNGVDIGVANGATVNRITRSGTAPASPVDGDIWVDTSLTPNVSRVRVGGAWQASANLVTQGSDIGVANGSTRNVVTYSASAPASPVDGDLWVDTSGAFAVFKMRVSGAWQIAANDAPPGTDRSEVVPVTISTSSVITVLIPDGASLTPEANIELSSTSGAGSFTLNLAIEYREVGGSYATVSGASGSYSDNVPDPANIFVSGTVTNSSGQDRLYDFRAVCTISPGDSGTVVAAASYLRA